MRVSPSSVETITTGTVVLGQRRPYGPGVPKVGEGSASVKNNWSMLPFRKQTKKPAKYAVDVDGTPANY